VVSQKIICDDMNFFIDETIFFLPQDFCLVTKICFLMQEKKNVPRRSNCSKNISALKFHLKKTLFRHQKKICE